MAKIRNHMRHGPFSEGLATGYVVRADPEGALSLRFRAINLERSNPLLDIA
jgi:hypothetical protein